MTLKHPDRDKGSISKLECRILLLISYWDELLLIALAKLAKARL